MPILMAAIILAACGSTATPPGSSASGRTSATPDPTASVPSQTSGTPSAIAPSGSGTAGPLPTPLPLAPSAIIDLPDTSDAIPITANGDDVWIGVDGAIVHVIGDTNAQRRIDVPRMRTGNGSLAVASDGLWVADWSGNRIERLDPDTGKVQLEAHAPGPVGFFVIGDQLWVGSEADHTVYPVDRRTGKLGSGVGSTEGVAIGVGQFWQGSPSGDSITRVDPATGSVIATIPVPSGSGCGVGGHFPEDVWAGCGKFPGSESPDGEVVARIDPTTNAVVATVRLPIYGGVVVANHVPWFFLPRNNNGSIESSLVAADPRTGALIAARDLGPLDLDGSVLTPAALWVSDEQGRRALRFDLAALLP